MRKQIGDRVLRGAGYEFGAGLTPSLFSNVSTLTVIDKRDKAELTVLFGAVPTYDVLSYEQAASRVEQDFITAHHVIEHCPDPIAVIMSWLPLVRDGGVVYFSLPSSNHACECDREPTPMSHLLADYLFEADGTDFDSRNHIPSFICHWTVMNPDGIWFAREGVVPYARQLLAEQARVKGHDLHWHTYTAAASRWLLTLPVAASKRCVSPRRRMSCSCARLSRLNGGNVRSRSKISCAD